MGSMVSRSLRPVWVCVSDCSSVCVQQGECDKVKPSRSRTLDEPLSETDTLVRITLISAQTQHLLSGGTLHILPSFHILLLFFVHCFIIIFSVFALILINFSDFFCHFSVIFMNFYLLVLACLVWIILVLLDNPNENKKFWKKKNLLMKMCFLVWINYNNPAGKLF